MGIDLLSNLCVKQVSEHIEIEAMLAYFPFFPHYTHQRIIEFMPPFRLRDLEMALVDKQLNKTSKKRKKTTSPFENDLVEIFDDLKVLLQQKWGSLSASQNLISYRTSRTKETGKQIDWRSVYWTSEFRSRLRQNYQHFVRDNALENAKLLSKNELLYYVDVVTQLKLRGNNEICRGNIPLILGLKHLKSIEFHFLRKESPSTKQKWLSVFELIEKVEKLQHVAFFHVNFSIDSMTRIIQSLRRLSCKIQINSLEFISSVFFSSSLFEFCDALEAGLNLSSLNMKNIAHHDSQSIDHFFFKKILGNSLLMDVSLSHNGFSDNFVSEFMIDGTEMLISKISTLNLSHNSLTHNSIKLLCENMHNNWKLMELVLDENCVGNEGAEYLSTVISSPSCLIRSLSVSNCNILIQGATKMLLCLQKNKSLKKFDIGHNYIGSEGGNLIARVLEENMCLNELNVTYIGLGLSGCTMKLADSLSKNITLTKLSLAENRILDTGATTLFNGIGKRTKILPFKEVDISGNLIGCKGLESILKHLSWKASDNSTSSTLIKHQLPVSDNNPRIQSLIVLNNIFGNEATEQLNSLKMLVGKLISNELCKKESIYDDEI